MGLRVPEDLSVVGFDNIPEAAYLKPGLTTVDQFIDRMGYAATEMLIGLIEGESLDNHLYDLPTEMVVRDSCQAVNISLPDDSKVPKWQS
jgi:LacI family transcriptional regulator